ncbi:MAG: HD domain-containing phosphohydrolase, partial [Candidatus Desulfatibia sp.]|uniref:HD-GYP domain-containing protein n=1 Tax=Candidatus Desulfatibia sp. TaxID=3101189 RepID=UPI002F2BF14E
TNSLKKELLVMAEHRSVRIAHQIMDLLHKSIVTPENESGSAFNMNEAGTLKALDDIIRFHYSRQDINRVIWYDENGIIIYSTLPSLIGQDASSNVDVQNALKGETKSKFEEHVDFDDLDPASMELVGEMVETYVSFDHNFHNLKMYGVMELYLDIANEKKYLQNIRYLFLLIVAAVFILLFIILLIITYRLDMKRTLLEEAMNRNMVEIRLLHNKVRDQNDILEQKVSERTMELALTQEATIFSLAVLAEFRDPETGGHIKRTQSYVKLLAEMLQTSQQYRNELNQQTIELLFKSAPLHDIGKVGVPDRILLKTGKLTDEEFEEMKKHTIYGRDAIVAAEQKLNGKSSFLKFAREIAYGHQEKWDGSGYPEGVKGEQIPLSARFMAVADVYDALISKRVYKPPFPHSKAVKIIREGKGTHFDPNVVDAFLKLEETFRKIALEFAEDEQELKTLSE